MGGLVMTDELEKLSDAKLSEVFAVEVLGWRAWFEKRGEYTHRVWQMPTDREPWMSVRNWEEAKKRYTPAALGEFNPMKHISHSWPPFATSADAVLPHVEKLAHRVEWGRSEGSQYGVFLWPAPVPCEPIRAIQPTLPRALCIVLIKAARAQKGAA
jgi:hypothetical protein